MDMLTNFVPYEFKVEKKFQFFKNLYGCLWKICASKQKIMRSKALDIITVHTKHFSTLLLNDYEKWHKELNKILEESQSYEILNGLRSFYKVIAIELVKEDKEYIFLVSP